MEKITLKVGWSLREGFFDVFGVFCLDSVNNDNLSIPVISPSLYKNSNKISRGLRIKPVLNDLRSID